MSGSTGEAEEATKTKGTSWTSVPETYGNLTGEKINNTLGKVGQPVGDGVSHVVAPVGNVVGGVVDPVMKLGTLANDAPNWGPGVESSARATGGNLLAKGQDALKRGQDRGEQHEGDEGSKDPSTA